MAITYVGGTVATFGSGSHQFYLTGITELAVGDIVVVMCAAGTTGSQPYADITGWQYGDSDISGMYYSSAENIEATVAARVMVGSVDTYCNVFVSAMTGTPYAVAIAKAFRGANSYDQDPVSYARSSTNPDSSSITPVNDDCVVIAYAASTAADSTPGTITNYSTPLGDSNIEVAAYAAYRILTGGAGTPENPAAFSSWSTGEYVALTIALNPLGGAYDLHEGGVQFVNPHSGGQNFNVFRKMVGWRKSLSGLLLPPDPLEGLRHG